MKKYRAFLIDLDGTMYRGKERIEEAVHFVQALYEKGLPYLFVTNNSSRTQEQVAAKLNDLEIPATPKQVFTTSMATANYIAAKSPKVKIYCIGEEGIKDALTKKGFEFATDNPDYVVIGIDREITYEKLAVGCLGIRGGATFISTNGDVAIPTERGLLPGNGSITAVLTVSTGINPIFIGKPEPIIIEQALRELGVNKNETLLIGDNYDTDILAGIRAGIDTLLVHTGVTTKEKLSSYPIQPTYVVDSLQEWVTKI